MKRLQAVLRALLFPPVVALFVLPPLCTALLIYSFLFSSPSHPVSILSFVLSAYTLTTVCVRLPRMCHRLRRESRLLHFWRNDVHGRFKLTLCISLALNTAYTVFQLGLGLYHRSAWFYTLSAYYLLLAVMRFSLLRYARRHSAGSDEKRELFQYRFCGYLLAVMNLVLAGILFFITRKGERFQHHEITTIAMAAYTFCALGIAIAGLVRYRKQQSPVYSCAKVISLAAALVSMLTLESAMLSAFGNVRDQRLHLTMTAVFGTVVALFVLSLAIFIILQTTKKIKALSHSAIQEKNNEG